MWMCQFGSILIRGSKRSPLPETDIFKHCILDFKPYEDARIAVIETLSGKKEFNGRKVGKS
jgi:hypothetical protein